MEKLPHCGILKWLFRLMVFLTTPGYYQDAITAYGEFTSAMGNSKPREVIEELVLGLPRGCGCLVRDGCGSSLVVSQTDI